jgi:hypothetical protein
MFPMLVSLPFLISYLALPSWRKILTGVTSAVTHKDSRDAVPLLRAYYQDYRFALDAF